MADNTSLLIGKSSIEINMLPRMSNRHGLIAGATGTGKTITLKVMAEAFSSIGVPVFLSDIKGDLASVAQAGASSPQMAERLALLGMESITYRAFPVRFWDVFGELGHPVRTTVSEMGPVLMARLLDLNDIQTGVMNIVFKIADDTGMLLIDLKDLRSMLQYVGDNSADFTLNYGSVSKQSIGAIQRGLLRLEEQGGEHFFAEPALDIADLLQTDTDGRGFINVLASEKLVQSPILYATFLLWILSELFEELPEVGDVDKPRIVFFFDEAHLLFTDAPKVLLEKIEQVVRLIRSKGVGIYFVSQNPADIPDRVLGQLGNRVQHALRAFTPRDQKSIQTVAETFRPNPEIDVARVITELKSGEALVSFLQADGSPQPVERAWIVPPASRFGTITPEERNNIISTSDLNPRYRDIIDRDSAYEMLQRKIEEKAAEAARDQQSDREEAGKSGTKRKKTGSKKPPAATFAEKIAKSAVTSLSSQIGRSIVRGILGSILKK